MQKLNFYYSRITPKVLLKWSVFSVIHVFEIDSKILLRLKITQYRLKILYVQIWDS